MMMSSWASFNSIIAVPVPIPDLNPWRTSCNWRLARRQVSISASTSFHRVYSRPMMCVLVVPFVIRIRTVHPNSCGISPMCHMFCIISTRHRHCSIFRGVFNFSPGYASLHHCLKWGWVCLPTLCGRRRSTSASTYTSNGISSFTFSGSTCVARGRPGGCGSSLW